MQISGKQSPSPTRVFVIAENRLLRETLARLFRKRSEISIVGDSCCSDSVLQEVSSAKSDILLLDCFNTSDKSDSWLTEVHESVPDLKLVLFGMDDDPDVFLRAVRLGIAGYVVKN